MISEAIGTVEFTGLAIIAMIARGQFFAHAVTRSATIVALVLNKSSRVIPTVKEFSLGLFEESYLPGFLGTPAGITTRSMPLSALANSSLPTYALTLARVSI